MSSTYGVLPHYYRISNLKVYVVLKVQQITSIHDGMRKIKADSHVTIWQDRTVFHCGSEVHPRVAFHIASSCDETLGRDVDGTSDKSWCHNSSGTLDFRSLAAPDPGLNFRALGTETAT